MRYFENLRVLVNTKIQTHHICGSRYRIQIDHVKPRALGGKNEIPNLRALCQTHNLLMAERTLGFEAMAIFRRKIRRARAGKL